MRAILVTGALVISGCKGLEEFNQDPNPNAPPPPTQPVFDCNNYTYQGETFNCSTLDKCDTTYESIPVRVACCDCDPTLCDPPAEGECPPPDEPVDPLPPEEAESCMECHNGSGKNDYLGTGISNPHPFGSGTQYLRCTQCHGGDGAGNGKAASHVPRPPELGQDDYDLVVNPEAYFNYLTRTGVDKYPDYTDPATGKTWTALDWLQFMNPGDIRAVASGRGCGQTGCHGGEHADWFSKSFIAVEQGFYSNTMFTVGAPNAVPDQAEIYTNTAADYAFRAVSNPSWVYDPDYVGEIGTLVEFPEYAVYGDPSGFYNNAIYDANTIANFRYAANLGDQYVNQVVPGSPLQHVVAESVTFQCGDCHAGSAGANNRYADFRSSGCTVCHMNYTLDGRSKSTDPNVPKNEPFNPDAIAAPERPHIESHQIRNVAKFVNTATGPTFISGIKDNACVGCHQGSNRTVLQFWGIRLDQNADLANGFQYPANPVTFINTAQDTRLFDPAVQNATFNGRNANQYILFEDYDGDLRDDTPADIHYERGLACIDCHGSRDVHNGTISDDGSGTEIADPNNGKMWSRMDQTVGVECESCHGDADYKAYTTSCKDYDGNTATCVTDRFGNPMRNVTRDGAGNYWLKSRLDGVLHYIPQTQDNINPSNAATHPLTGQLIYTANGSYAMGVADDSTLNGIGPKQVNPDLYTQGFTHMDNLACDACHASWNNNCEGCHLQLLYNDNNNAYFFSNTTGERITVQVTNADFTYINPFNYYLEVNPKGEVASGQPGMKAFYRYVDQNGNLAAGITFSDRNGMGSNPASAFGTSQFPSLSHNRIYAHSVRGRVDAYNEGPRSCNECHLNVDMVNDAANWAAYVQFYTDYADQNYANLDFNALQQFIGLNTHNAQNSPYWVHMVAGLGSGTLLFDANGCPVNPLDNNANRQFCNNVAPADQFNINNVAYDLDRVVEVDGSVNSSFTKPMLDGYSPLRGDNPTLSGPLGEELLRMLADPNTALILDSYVDSNANAQGGAANFILFAEGF